MSKSRVLVLVLALAHLTCAAVPLTAPSGSTLTLNANPTFVPANGGTSAVTAIVVEPAGTFVPDGTVVFFLTNLGRIDAQAKTKGGFAYATFVADSRSGTATVQAFSGGDAPSATPSASPTPTGVSGSVSTMARSTVLSAPVAVTTTPVPLAAASDSKTITVGSANPREIIVTANPPRITEPRNTEITATVYDESGNPVSNVPVVFTVAVPGGRLLQEALDSGSQPRFTDTNGQARDTLRTSQNRADPQKQVNVTATIPVIGDSNPLAVFIN
jgi:hypothetical protein